MAKVFNVTGACIPELHYMVNIDERLEEIKTLVNEGKYFTINRARQYGKTTTLMELEEYLKNDYYVISMDFQLFGNADFSDENAFSKAFAGSFLRVSRHTNIHPTEDVQRIVSELKMSISSQSKFLTLRELFEALSDLCDYADKPLVLLIDEVDSATNNQVFLDFLSQLRGYYIRRNSMPTFQAVILAGVYDVKNLKRKLRPDENHKENSPWNISAKFDVDMNFSKEGIAGMLREYEADYHTGMSVDDMSGLIYDYTSGYPFLVSRMCQLMDVEIPGMDGFGTKESAWTKQGLLVAVKQVLTEKNTLFLSLTGKIKEYPELRELLYTLLFDGKTITYNPDDDIVDMASMFGFVKKENENVVIANRIFETRLYNLFLTSDAAQSTELYNAGSNDKNQFVQNGHLNMEHILEKFVQHFDDLYGDQPDRFAEEDGRRYFLLYLRPIINGTGNYYIEAQTRNREQTDVIVDYMGEQIIVELKIWRGDAYNTRGEKQLSDYLDYYHLKKGYMLSFNFNKKKEIGIKHIELGDKLLVEAVV